MDRARAAMLRRRTYRAGFAASAAALFTMLAVLGSGNAGAQWPPVALDGDAGNNVLEIRAFGDRVEFCTDGFCFDLDRFEVPSITVNGHEGDDVLIVDHAGSFILGTQDDLPISFDGGSPGTGSDRLEICPTSCGGSGVKNTSYTPSSSGGQGSVDQTDANGHRVQISFAHVGTVLDTSPGQAAVAGNGATNAIGVRPSDLGEVVTTVDASTPFHISEKSDLTLDASAADDTITVEPKVGATSLSELRVLGGEGTGDQLIVRGTSDPDRLEYGPSAVDRADIDVDGAPRIDARTVEGFTYAGGGGPDDLILTTPPDNTIVAFSPGANAGTGALTARQKSSTDGTQLLPLTFTDVGGDGNVRIEDASGGREDTLLYTGLDTSTASDTLELDAGRVRLLVADTSVRAALDVEPTGAKDVVVDARGGDDAIAAAGPFPYVLQVDGGGGTDLVGLSGPDHAVAIAPASGQVEGYGKPVRVLSERLHADVGGFDASVSGTTGPDHIMFTPLTASSARVSVGGSGSQTDLLNASGILTVDALEGADRVTVNGTSQPDAIEVSRGDPTHVRVGGLRPVSVPASTEMLEIGSGPGNDAVAVFGSGGPAGLSIADESGASDVLRVTGLLEPRVSAGHISDPTGDTSHTGIDALQLEGTGGPLTALGSDGDDALTQDDGTIRIDDDPEVAYTGFASLSLDGRGGLDHISVQPATAAVSQLLVSGGLGPDELQVRGRDAADAFAVTPTGPGAGIVETAGLPRVAFDGTESAAVDGARGEDTFTMVATANDDDIEYVPGAGGDEASIRVGTLVPVRFAGLGAGGAVVVDGRAGADKLIHRGTATDDSFAVAPDGTITFAEAGVSHVPVSTRALETLTLDSAAGADAFSVPGNHPYGSILANGGDPAGGDGIVFNGAGGPVTIDVGAGVVREAGPVRLSGIESASVRATGASVDVHGTGQADTIHYSPASPTGGRISHDTAHPIFDLADVGGALTLDPRGGTDHVLVAGTAGPDLVDVTRGDTAAVAVGSLKPVRVVSASTETLTVQTLEGDDSVRIDGNGGPVTLAVDGGPQQLEDTLSVRSLPSAVVSAASVVAPDASVGHAGIERVSVEGTDVGPLTVSGTDGADAISQAGPEVRIGAASPVSYQRFTALDVRAAGGDDRLSLVPSGAGVALMAADGGPGTDAIVAEGSPGTDDVLSEPIGTDAGQLSFAGAPAIRYTTIESITADGNGGGDVLRIAAGAGDHTITATPADPADAGTLQVAGLISTQFAELGDGQIVVDGGDGTDLLVQRGTSGDDTFTVAADGSVRLVQPSGARVPVRTENLEHLTVQSLLGADATRIAGRQPYAVARIEGGDGADSLTFDGSGGTLAVDLDAATVREINPVLTTGTETIMVGAAGAAVAVTGSPGPETIRFAPTDVDAAAVHRDGSPLALRLAGVGEPLVIDPGMGADLIEVSATSGPDAVSVQRGGMTTVAVGSLQQLTVPAAATETVTVQGHDADDTVSVSGAGGPGSLGIGGGNGTDSLLVTGQRDATTSPGSVLTSGGIVRHAAVEHITLEGTDDGTVTVTGGDADDAISQSRGSVLVNGDPAVSYSRFVRLAIRSLGGNDHLTTVPGEAMVSDIAVDAGTGADSLVVTGRVTPDAVTITPTAADGGSIALDARPPLTFAGAEAVEYDGRGGGDHVTMVGSTASDIVTYTPDVTVDSGRLRVGSLVGARFQSLGEGAVTVDGRGGTDTLVFRGTGADDVFDIASDGAVLLGGATGLHVGLDTIGVEALTTHALSGGDSATVAGGNPYDPVRLEGGDGADTVRFIGGGTGVRLDLGSQTLQENHPVAFTGIEALTVDAVGASVGVDGSTSGDVLTYTPATPDSGRLVREGSGPPVELRGAGALTLDPREGADVVNVIATVAADQVQISRGDISTVSVADSLPVAMPGAATESLMVRTQDGDDRTGVSGAGGPGSLTVDTGSGVDTFVMSGQQDVTAVDGRLISTGGTVAHAGVERISLDGTAAGTLTMVATDAGDTIAQSGNEVVVNGGIPVSFSGYLGLDVRSGGGADTVRLRPTSLVGVGRVTADAAGGTDLVAIHGSLSDERIVYTPISATTAQVDVSLAPPIILAGTESVEVDGASAAGGADELVIDSSAISATLVLTPDTALDAGRVDVLQGAPVLAYSGLGAGRVAFADAFRADHLVYRATASNNTTSIDAQGVLHTDGRSPVDTPGIAAVTVETFAGDDLLTVAGDHPFPGTNGGAGVQIDAGQGTDRTHVMGSGDRIGVEHAAGLVRQAGFAATGFSGVETVHADAAGSATHVGGDAGSDTVCFEPLAHDAGRLRATAQKTTDGTCPADATAVTYELTKVGSFFVDPGAGIDEVLIAATSAPDEIRLVNHDASHQGFATVIVDPVDAAAALLPAHVSTATAEAVRLAAGAGSDVIAATVYDHLGPIYRLDGETPDANKESDALTVCDGTGGGARLQNMKSRVPYAGTVIADYSGREVRLEYRSMEDVTLLKRLAADGTCHKETGGGGGGGGKGGGKGNS